MAESQASCFGVFLLHYDVNSNSNLISAAGHRSKSSSGVAWIYVKFLVGDRSTDHKDGKRCEDAEGLK